MGLVNEIKNNIDRVTSEMNWLRKEINYNKGEDDIDLDIIESRFQDVELVIEDLNDNVVSLLENLEDLI